MAADIPDDNGRKALPKATACKKCCTSNPADNDYCSDCGHMPEAGTSFCTKCGSPLN